MSLACGLLMQGVGQHLNPGQRRAGVDVHSHYSVPRPRSQGGRQVLELPGKILVNEENIHALTNCGLISPQGPGVRLSLFWRCWLMVLLLPARVRVPVLLPLDHCV